MLVPTQQILKGGSSPTPVVENDGSKPRTATDREKLDAGRKALKELLRKREQKKKNKTCADILRLYGTIFGGLLVIGGFAVLMFLVPMTIDPALATLTFEFSPEPAICITTSFIETKGLTNTTWCSCLEGCTQDVFECYQIEVAYKSQSRHGREVRSVQGRTSPSIARLPDYETQWPDNRYKLFPREPLPPSQFTQAHSSIDHKFDASNNTVQNEGSTSLPSKFAEEIVFNGEGVVESVQPYYEDHNEEVEEDFPGNFSNFISDEPFDPFSEDIFLNRHKRSVDLEEWDFVNASLFVNVKGCGYPPIVNCNEFKLKYKKLGRRYYCYYSKSKPYLVLDEYDPDAAAVDLYYSFGLPVGSIIGGSVLICLMQMPYKKFYKRIRRRKLENER